MNDQKNSKQIFVDNIFDVLLVYLLRYEDDVFLDIMVKENNQMVRAFDIGVIVIEKYEKI
jgi:hypothetical protein